MYGAGEGDQPTPRGKPHNPRRASISNPYPDVSPYFPDQGYGYAPHAYPVYDPYDVYNAASGYPYDGYTAGLPAERPDPFQYMDAPSELETQTTAKPVKVDSTRSGRSKRRKSSRPALHREYYEGSNSAMVKVRGGETESDIDIGFYSDGSEGGWTTRSVSPERSKSRPRTGKTDSVFEDDINASILEDEKIERAEKELQERQLQEKLLQEKLQQEMHLQEQKRKLQEEKEQKEKEQKEQEQQQIKEEKQQQEQRDQQLKEQLQQKQLAELAVMPQDEQKAVNQQEEQDEKQKKQEQHTPVKAVPVRQEAPTPFRERKVVEPEPQGSTAEDEREATEEGGGKHSTKTARSGNEDPRTKNSRAHGTRYLDARRRTGTREGKGARSDVEDNSPTPGRQQAIAGAECGRTSEASCFPSLFGFEPPSAVAHAERALRPVNVIRSDGFSIPQRS